MQGSGGELYIGTSDESQSWESLPGVGSSLNNVFGFDAFATTDGVHITQLTNNGFGSILNFGIARMADTPYGAFLGGANVQNGLNIWKDSTSPSTFPAPADLQIEMTGNKPLLSWNSDPNAVSYRVLRAPLTTFTDLSVFFHNPTITGSYVSVGTTASLSFKDSPITGSEQYLYFVVGEDAQGNLSDHSNLVYAPPLAPAPDFDELLAQVDGLGKTESLYLNGSRGGDEVHDHERERRGFREAVWQRAYLACESRRAPEGGRRYRSSLQRQLEDLR